MDEFGKLSSEQQEQLTQPFDRFIQELQGKTLIAVIRDTFRRFEEDKYPRLLEKMEAWAHPQTPPAPYKPTTHSGTELREHKVEYVAARNLEPQFDKAWLADEADVERYLVALKAAMMKACGFKRTGGP